VAEPEEETRASGLTAAEEVTREESAALDKPIENDTMHVERKRTFKTTGLARMRTTDWDPETKIVMDMLARKVDEVIEREFYEALVIMNRVYDPVREQDTDPQTGKPLMDRFGWPVWRRHQTGGYVEDWTRMTDRDREGYLYQITLYLFEWQQTQADLWAQSMYAKAVWEDSFSEGYESVDDRKATIEARTARGRLHAREDRYFAIFQTHISRRADGIVQSMERISQRLKDTLPQR
jgi:hypothetical protein